MRRFRFLAAALAALVLPLAALAGPKEDILAAHQKMLEKGKFRITGTTTSKKNTTALWMEVEWPDRYHMRNADAEFIIVPGRTFMKQGNQWMPFPMDMSNMIRHLTPEAMRQGYEAMRDVQDLGTEDVDGRPARVYAYATSGEIMGIRSDSRVKLWIDADSGLVVKQVVDGEAMRIPSTTEQRYEYDPSIAIRAPN